MSDGARRRTTGPAKGGRALRPKVAAPVPTDPVELLGQPLGLSGFAAAHVLRRSGRRLGVDTVRDLLFHLPRRYDDLREMRRLDDLVAAPDGAIVSARVRVTDLRVQQTFRRRVQVTTAYLADETGTAEATWFGRRFIERRLRPGDELIVSGKLKHRGFGVVFDDPEFQRADSDSLLHVGRIVPVYRLTSGLTAARLRQAMREALDKAGYAYPEYLPAAIQAAEELPPITEALEHAHYPTIVRGTRRGPAAPRVRRAARAPAGHGLAPPGARPRAHDARSRSTDPVDSRIRRALEESLTRKLGHEAPLTADQSTAIDEIRADLARPVPMLRLVQGDVGSGKTAVAAWALAAAALDGRQAALLAPTDLLARQHAATLADLVEDLALPVTLLTGSLSGEGRRKALEAIASGQAAIVVGTHALFQEAVAFADLALAVVDEQHRFGVEQRGALEAKATRGVPHVLLMTATPIPRTLGQVLYADLDVSDAPHLARRSRPDPDRHPSPDRARGDLGQGQGRGGRRAPDVRRRAADRTGRWPVPTRARATRRIPTPGSSVTTSCPTRTSRPRGPRQPRRSSSGSRASSRRCGWGSSTAGSSPPIATWRWRASGTGISTCSSGPPWSRWAWTSRTRR